MSTNFPTSLDSLTNPLSTDTMSAVPHATQHANANDAIEALEAKVGVDGSAVTTSHDYKLGNCTGTLKAKEDNVSATDKLLGRSTAGAGEIEEIDCTAAGRALLDDANAAAQRTTLGLGTAATSNTGDFAAASHTHVAADISDSTAAGRTLLTDADAAAQRTSLGLGAIALRPDIVNADVNAAAAIAESKLALTYGTSGLNSRIATLEDLTIWDPSNRIVRQSVWRTGATIVDQGEVGSTTGTGSLTASAVSATQPQGGNYASGAASGNAFSWGSTAHHITGVDCDFDFVIRPVDSANVRYYIGIANSVGSNWANDDTPGDTAAYQLAVIGYRSSIDTNWQLFTSTGSAVVVTDTGVAYVNDTLIRVGIRVRNSGADISAVINGAVAVTYSGSTKPTNTTAMLMTGVVNTTTTAAKNLRMFRQRSSVKYW